MAKNSRTHAKRVASAMSLIHSGKAATKKEAAAAVGISNGALTPSRIEHTLDKAPEIRQQLMQRLELLEITVDVERAGKIVAVSAREIFSTGCKSSLATLERHAGKTGNLTREEREAVKQAREWLKMSHDFGLFKGDAAPSGVPAEIANAEERQRSAKWYLLNHRRTDGRKDGETLTAPAAQVTRDTAAPAQSEPGE